MATVYYDAAVRCKELEAENAQLRAALTQAVRYADVVSLEDGMPEGKQAKRLTATWVGPDIHYAAEWDVKAARALIDLPPVVTSGEPCR